MEALFDLLTGKLQMAGILPLVLLVVLLIGVVPLAFAVIFMVDSINLMRSSRIVIKGKEKVVLNYPVNVDGVTQCETSGLIRSNLSRQRTSADRFEPDALRQGELKEENSTSYNYDEADGIPAVDRPLFKPKDQ